MVDFVCRNLKVLSFGIQFGFMVLQGLELDFFLPMDLQSKCNSS